MSDESSAQNKQIVRREDQDGSNLPAETKIALNKNTELDLAGLTPEQVQQLKLRHAEGIIDLTNAAHKKATDVQALDAGLRSMSQHTSEVAESGQSVTITHTQDNEFGRTEVIMGTSDAAKKGKLTRSQTGERDYTLVWAGLGVFVIVVVALIVLMG